MINKALYLILSALFSLTVFSCAKDEEEEKAPAIAVVNPVTTPTSNPTPSYTFSSTKAGTIRYGGTCSSQTTSATRGNNTINFKTLSDGTYSDCTLIVTDSDGNSSNTLSVNTFIVDTTPEDNDTTTSSSSGKKFVAVGEAGTILTSTSNNLWGVTFANSKFVSIGTSGTILNSSDNGTTWNPWNSGKTLLEDAINAD